MICCEVGNMFPIREECGEGVTPEEGSKIAEGCDCMERFFELLKQSGNKMKHGLNELRKPGV